MSELATLNAPTFSACVVHDERDLVVRLVGNADVAVQEALDQLFRDAHQHALELGVTRVHVDMRELGFMSSSCIKAVVLWLEKVRKTDEAKRYLVTFLASKVQPWQRRTLKVLGTFARDIMSVEVF